MRPPKKIFDSYSTPPKNISLKKKNYLFWGCTFAKIIPSQLLTFTLHEPNIAK